MRRRIGIDIDNTLCEGQHWTAETCLNAKPYPKMIDFVNKLYMTDFIVIYTARQDFLMESTLKWLKKNGVNYHAIANGKPPLDILVDDVAFWPWKRKEPKWI